MFFKEKKNKLTTSETPEDLTISKVDLKIEPPEESQPMCQEREWKYKLHDQLLMVIDLQVLDKLEEQEARIQIRDITQSLMNSDPVSISELSRKKILHEIEDEILGLGPLELLLSDPHVADILVNGYDSVFIEKNGLLEKTSIRFRDNQHLMNIIDRIVSSVGRRLDESSPMVDARLKDGSRVNVIIPPLALDGPMLSIRRFSVQRLNIDSLLELGSISESFARVVEGAVQTRLNILISGGTGSGKTTLLNILSAFIPKSERIVTIEDTAELQLQQPHVVRLETRPPNIENKGEITQRDLVRNSLRMRPERIIIGEVRAAEAFDMLQAMNTGHDGSLATVHANSPRDSLIRIENMIYMTGFNLPTKAIRSQIASAINIVIQVDRLQDGKRKVVSLQEIDGMEGDVIRMSEIFTFRRDSVDKDGNVKGELIATGIVPKFYEHLVQRGFDIDLKYFNQGSNLG